MTFPVLPDQVGVPVRTDTSGTVRARANCGRWVADCARPFCRNAWALEYEQGGWVCNTCGTANTVVWPADPAAIEYMLMMRPDPFTRSWDPDEPLEQLIVENVANGIIPPEIENLIGSSHDILTVVDGRAVSGVLLPGIEDRRLVLAAAAAPGRQALIDGRS